MTIYIVLLRGINVGGNHIIKMAELRSMLEKMGLKRVQTYIQSGNVVFESEEDATTLRTRMESEIKSEFGFPAAVMIRTSEEMERIIENGLLASKSLGELDNIYVSMLHEAPSQEQIDQLPQWENETGEYRIIGRDVYLFLRKKISDIKFPKQWQQFSAPATMRNWNTMNKLATMARAMKS